MKNLFISEVFRIGTNSSELRYEGVKCNTFDLENPLSICMPSSIREIGEQQILDDLKEKDEVEYTIYYTKTVTIKKV